MCTGHSPFRAETVMAVLRRVSDHDPRPIREINPDIPDWLEAIVTKLLAKDPAARFQSAAEVADLLTRCLAYVEDPDRLTVPYQAASPERSSAAVKGAPVSRPTHGLIHRGRWALVVVATLAAATPLSLGRRGSPVPARRGAAGKPPEPQKVQEPVPARRGAAAGLQPPAALNSVPPWESVRAVAAPNVGRRPLSARFGQVLGTAYSPDGKTLAMACVDRKVRLWDVASDTLRATLVGHTSEVRSVAFSQDGVWLVSGGGAWDDYSVPGEVKLWNLDSNTESADLKGHTSVVYAVGFGPDGKTVASASADRTAKLWDVSTASVRSSLKAHTDVVNCLAYSPDGKTLATCSPDSTIRFWDTATGSERSRITTRQSWIGIAFSPSGKTLASIGGTHDGVVSSTGHRRGSVTIWDAQTREPLDSFDDVAVEFLAVAFSPDGTIVASATSNYAMSGEVKLWNVAQGRLEATLPHGDVPASLAYAPDGKQLAVGLRGRLSAESVMIWEVPVLRDRRSDTANVLPPAPPLR